MTELGQPSKKMRSVTYASGMECYASVGGSQVLWHLCSFVGRRELEVPTLRHASADQS